MVSEPWCGLTLGVGHQVPLLLHVSSTCRVGEEALAGANTLGSAGVLVRPVVVTSAIVLRELHERVGDTVAGVQVLLSGSLVVGCEPDISDVLDVSPIGGVRVAQSQGYRKQLGVSVQDGLAPMVDGCGTVVRERPPRVEYRIEDGLRLTAVSLLVGGQSVSDLPRPNVTVQVRYIEGVGEVVFRLITSSNRPVSVSGIVVNKVTIPLHVRLVAVLHGPLPHLRVLIPGVDVNSVALPPGGVIRVHHGRTHRVRGVGGSLVPVELETNRDREVSSLRESLQGHDNLVTNNLR